MTTSSSLGYSTKEAVMPEMLRSSSAAWAAMVRLVGAFKAAMAMPSR